MLPAFRKPVHLPCINAQKYEADVHLLFRHSRSLPQNRIAPCDAYPVSHSPSLQTAPCGEILPLLPQTSPRFLLFPEFPVFPQKHTPLYTVFSRHTSCTPGMPLNTQGTISASQYPSRAYNFLAAWFFAFVSIRRYGQLCSFA